VAAVVRVEEAAVVVVGHSHPANEDKEHHKEHEVSEEARVREVTDRNVVGKRSCNRTTDWLRLT
jgi:hypothetical protein